MSPRPDLAITEVWGSQIVGIEAAICLGVPRPLTQLGQPLSEGSRGGRYEVIRPLARGDMSELYLVKNCGPHGFESLVVLKRLPPHCLVSEPNLVNMFMDEARITASLRLQCFALLGGVGTLAEAIGNAWTEAGA